MADTYVNFNAKLRPNMAAALDEEAREIGISRMALIQVILHEHLKERALVSEKFSVTERYVDFDFGDGIPAPSDLRSGFRH